MEQKLLDQVQSALSRHKELNEQIEDTKKQLAEKEGEFFQFIKDWQLNCNHVFYRVQQKYTSAIYTLGYRCCLCGKFEKIKNSTQYSTKKRKIQRKSQSTYPYRPPVPHYTSQPEETHEFIGTVIENSFSKSDMTDEERFPVPAEYQEEVNAKKAHFDKLISEKEILALKLKELESSKKAIREELDEIAHLLNSTFGYHNDEPYRWGGIAGICGFVD